MNFGLAEMLTTVRGLTLSVTLAAVAMAPGDAPKTHVAGHWRTLGMARHSFPLIAASGATPRTGAGNVDVVLQTGEPPTGLLGPPTLFARSEPPRAWSVRNRSGLSVAALSKLFGVSRQAYHAWMVGATLSAENADKVEEVLALVDALCALGVEPKSFLTTEQFGAMPIELVAQGRYDAVLGLAKYPDVPPEADVVTPLDWNAPDAGVVAAFRYKGETNYAVIDREEERYLDDAIPVTTIVVSG